MRTGLTAPRGFLICVVAAIWFCGCSSKPDTERATPAPQPADTGSSSAKPPVDTGKPEPPAASSAQIAAPPPSPATEAARPSGPIQFTDVTAAAGIHFKHNSGAFGKKYLPETMGSGVCFID